MESSTVKVRQWRKENLTRWKKLQKRWQRKNLKYFRDYMRRKRDKVKQAKLDKVVKDNYQKLFKEEK